MRKLKKQITIFLCAILAVIITVTAMPQEIKAAGKLEFTNANLLEELEVWIYKGAKKLYIGDYIRVIEDKKYYKLGYGYLTGKTGVTYESSDLSVADIHSKTGKITAKKAGETTITVEYKGKKISMNVHVADNKEELAQYVLFSYAEETQEVIAAIADIEERAAAFFEVVGEARPKFTDSNRCKIASACLSFDNSVGEPDDTIGIGGYGNKFVIYAPEATRACIIEEQMRDYYFNKNPFYSKNKNAFQVKSISGKGNSKKITMKLKNKVTDEQLFGIQTNYIWDTEIRDTKKATFPLAVKNMKNGYRYYVIATVKKGSNKITIDTGDLKLKKGVTYQILDESGLKFLEGVAKKDTFKAS